MPDIESHDYRRFAILIIDPDESVRLSFRRTLGEKFWILEARSDNEALALLKRQTEGVGVIVRDELLPPSAADTEALATIVADYPKTVRVLSGHEDLIGKAVALKSEMDAEESSAALAQQAGADDSVEVSDEPPAAPGEEGILDQAEVLFQNRNRVFYVTRPWDMGQLEATLSRAMELFVVGHERDQWRNAHHQGIPGGAIPAPYPTVALGGGTIPAPYPTIPMAVGVGPDGQAAYVPTIMALPGMQFAAPIGTANEPADASAAKPAAKRPPAKKSPEKDKPANLQTPPTETPAPPQMEPLQRPVPSDRPQVPFWKKLGGGSLSISLIIHGIILAVGLILIIQVIPAPKKPPVDFMPSAGGGGDPSSSSKVKAKQRKAMNSAAPRVAAKDVASGFTLPEPQSSDMTSLPSLSSGSISGGLGGSGSGGGKGDGTGKGFGSGTGIGMGGGTGKMSPFGMLEPANNALIGTFYDLKQDRNRRPTNVGEATAFNDIVDKSREILHDFVKRGWNERDFAKYYQAPQKLYQTKIFMPSMGADEAPKAFNCEKEVQGSRWVVVYRGVVRPPKTGKFRFVGAGDDVLAIRFAGKMVFDYGYESATANIGLNGKASKLKDDNDRDWKRLRRDMAMPSPVEIRPQGSARIVKDLGGLAVGPEFEVNAGTDYPIEILISEIPGGFFAAYLMIEEIGATYQKDKTGSPILPVFRLDSNPPAQGEGPPFDPNGPVWQLTSGRGKVSI